ncbi:MAG TPA: GGDEF domain-containing protein [Polyangiaceae bacterium]|nr:GGDEF domain-containing protein [Polyangiaceae bacterium]
MKRETKTTLPEMPAVHELDFDDDEVTDVSQRAHDSEVAPPDTRSRRGALVVLKGADVGRTYVLDADTIIGRSRDATIHYDDKGMSRRHARVLKQDNRFFVEDLGSRNGTFVSGERVIGRTELVDGARIVLSAGLVLRFNMLDEVEERVTKQLFEASTRDALMNIYNRRYFDERLAAEVSFAHRHKGLLGLLLFDIDHFKRINDTHGHLAGDAVLQAVSKKLGTLIRTEDVLARYGGEEIGIIARGVPLDGLVVLADRLRRAVHDTVTAYENLPLRVTVSIGVATISECDAHATGDLLVALADERLYKAKHAGRNRVVSE